MRTRTFSRTASTLRVAMATYIMIVNTRFESGAFVCRASSMHSFAIRWRCLADTAKTKEWLTCSHPVCFYRTALPSAVGFCLAESACRKLAHLALSGYKSRTLPLSTFLAIWRFRILTQDSSICHITNAIAFSR